MPGFLDGVNELFASINDGKILFSQVSASKDILLRGVRSIEVCVYIVSKVSRFNSQSD
jgi:hypothetical protein